MIEVKHVTKTFDGFRALDGLTMSVPDGSIYGLVGPNGAGKSTILRHITGIYRQDEGEVLVAGEPVYENPAVKARIASIPDELYYFLDLIDEYYSESGILDAKPDEDGCIEVDLGQIVDYIIKEAHKDEMGEYDPEEILFVVQGELEYTESLDDDEE